MRYYLEIKSCAADNYWYANYVGHYAQLLGEETPPVVLNHGAPMQVDPADAGRTVDQFNVPADKVIPETYPELIRLGLPDNLLVKLKTGGIHDLRELVRRPSEQLQGILGLKLYYDLEFHLGELGIRLKD